MWSGARIGDSSASWARGEENKGLWSGWGENWGVETWLKRGVETVLKGGFSIGFIVKNGFRAGVETRVETC